jgi:biopolymer transport protein TolR
MDRMRRARKSINQINVVPYIDVMLVLLIIFMVTAPLITPGVIELPTVGTKLTPPPSPPLKITLNADKTFSLEDQLTKATQKRLSVNDAVAQILELQAKQERPVVIEAAANARYEEVIKLIDLLQQKGVKRVGLLARSPT